MYFNLLRIYFVKRNKIINKIFAYIKKGLYFYRRNFILIKTKLMKVKFLTVIWFVLGCCFSVALAQTISVKGTVTDESKLPMPGVSVVG